MDDYDDNETRYIEKYYPKKYSKRTMDMRCKTKRNRNYKVDKMSHRTIV